MSKLRPLIVFGTRPEAIKLALLVKECERRSEAISATVCVTGQHREMLQQVNEYFGVQPDLNLELMRPDQKLAGLTARCVSGVDEVIQQIKPDCIVAQGDTTTVMATSLAAFYRHIPLVHVEAGLRTNNVWAPWPEEMNRRVTSLVTSLHCAPTERSAQNLLSEGVPANTVHVTGNTVIDALLWTVDRERGDDRPWGDKHSYLGDQPMVLITGHRRENFGIGFLSICQAIGDLADQHPDTAFLYPVHLNPNVQQPVHEALGNRQNIYLLEPVPYPEFVWLMDRSTIILSDSGGIQEEAPSLNKPVLVMRETTERPEALDAGAVELVGTDRLHIVSRVSTLLTDSDDYARHQIAQNPYGDGQACSRIVELMLQRNWNQKT